jgi:23S rRNA (uracil1939-C5)-methyltransferase
MTFGPYAITRVDGKSVMIPGAVIGDLLEIETSLDKRNYTLGKITRVVQPSAERREPPCLYAAECGGCDWQHIRYAAQARFKAELVAAEFRRGLGIALDPGALVEPAPTEFRYRSRVRLKAGAGGKVGFHHPDTNLFVAVEDCLVAAPQLSPVAELARALGRNCAEIEVVARPHGTVLIANLIKAPGAFERKIARTLSENGTTGLILRGGSKRELFGITQIACEAEPGCIIEADADLFSQINRAQNLKLVAAVMQLGELSQDMGVLDLFCGTGNFSLPAARRTRRVIGFDHDELAIEAARANAGRMGLEATQFIAMRASDGVRFLLQSGYAPDVLIMDPPRAGAANLIDSIVSLRTPKLIYVSCNLATLVRDLRGLTMKGYKVSIVRAFDFFPNTHHIEIVASLLLT